MTARTAFAGTDYAKKAAFLKWIREEAGKALQRPLPITSKKNTIEELMSEMLTQLVGADKAKPLAPKVTQAILKMLPRTASEQHEFYKNLEDLAQSAQDAADYYAEASDTLAWLAEGIARPKPGADYGDLSKELRDANANAAKGGVALAQATRFESRLASRVVTAYVSGHKESIGYIDGINTQTPYAEGVGSQTPPARDRNGRILEVPGHGILQIPGYEWHDKSDEFHKP